MTPLDAALRYPETGLAIFPVEPREKRPCGQLVPHGFEDATTDPAIIRGWWQTVPDANIGLPCEANGAVFVDVDVRHGGIEAFRAFRGDRRLPMTWVADTGGGGRHYGFRLPPGVKLRGKLVNPDTAEVIEGVDIKVAGYIAVWPSIHPSGGQYQWLPGMAPWDRPLAEAPDWLLAGMIRPEPKPADQMAPPTSTAPAGDRLTDEEIARRALAEMSADRADDYETWVEVGQACHQVGDQLLPDWLAWSAQSHKFDEAVCRRKWQSFRRGAGRTLGTLVEYARQDGSNLLQPGYRQDERKPATPRLRDADTMGEAMPQPEPFGPPNTPECLSDWGPWIDDLLCNGKPRDTRNTRQQIAEALTTWALAGNRLIWDPAAKGAYLLDRGRVVLVTPKAGMALRAAMIQLGVNPAEDTFKWLVHSMEAAAYEQGRHVTISRWVTYRTEAGSAKVYITCGERELVRSTATADGVVIERLPNGTDDVWFAEDAWFPAWQIADGLDPLRLAAFNCPVDEGGQVHYDAWTQRRLLRLWLVAAVSGVRPLWMLALLGGKGSGKTTTCRAVAKLLDPASDVTATPDDVRDFETAIITQAICPMDNVDAEADNLPKWLPDRLATTVTGGQVRRRALYTNGDTYLARITSCVALSSRTAAYSRPDLTERTMPVMTRELEDSERIPEVKLWAEVEANRDGALTWLAGRAAQVILMREQAPTGLPSRFIDAAQLLWADLRLDGLEDRTVDCLRAMGRAQAVMIQGGNPLLDAIMEDTSAGQIIRGTPKEIVDEMERNGHDIPYFGGWKKVGSQLRELRGVLRSLGYRFAESEQGNATVFTIEPPRIDDDDPFTI